MKNISDPLFAKKSLGQNFLVDQNILRKMAKYCQLTPEDSIFEIGPGKGALTEYIAPMAKKLTVIEKDKRFIELLNEKFSKYNIEIINEDILKFSFESILSPVKLIGNLPYNIASPIIEKILYNRHLFKDVFITVQLEHGQRMVAKANEEDYSAFSCFVQYYSSPQILFTIPGQAFSPAPKVQSCFMHLSFPFQNRTNANNENLLFNLIRSGFNQRRKTIENSLEAIIPKPVLRQLCTENGLNEKWRAENVPLEGFISLANGFEKISVTN